jgi:hypothetical protein
MLFVGTYMKIAVILSLVSIAFFSCSKSDSPTPPVPAPPVPVPTVPAPDTLLKSYSVYYPQLKNKLVEIFTYNANSAIVTLRGYTHDSSGGPALPDSVLISFAQTTANIPPASYDVSYYSSGAVNTDHHQLFYDNQNRAVRDSITSSSVGDQSTQHIFYDGVNETIQWLFPDAAAPGGYSVSQIDTISIQNNNISSDINYTVSGGVENFIRLKTYQSSVKDNPLYSDLLSTSLGSLMVFNNLGDYRSKNLPSQSTSDAGGSQITLNYVWTTDASGRVIHGIGTDGNGLIQEIYDYSY